MPARCEIECLRSDRPLPALQVTVCPHMYLRHLLLKNNSVQSEIYTPGAAFSNSFMISSRTSEDLREELLLLASSFDLRGPEWKVVS